MKRDSEPSSTPAPTRRPAWPRRLLAWYDASHRDLPWRGNVPPYAVWVSEIMLQQTRVETVIPYYHRFLERFPDVVALADAKLSVVLKLWEGLGYYTRARNLHAAAIEVVRRHGGRMPCSVEELGELPGIGRYTAAAIASIAANEVVPVLDGNVARVMARFLALISPIEATGTLRTIEDHLRSSIPSDRPGDFNQALMELGALVCKPGEPDCPSCPLRRVCVARRDGIAGTLPLRKRKKKIPVRTVAAGVVLRGARALIVRRTRKKMLGGLWEWPGGQPRRGEKLQDAVERTIREETGCEVRVERKLYTIRQEYSHFAIRLHVYLCRDIGKRRYAPSADAQWVPLAKLNRYAFGRAAREVLTRIC